VRVPGVLLLPKPDPRLCSAPSARFASFPSIPNVLDVCVCVCVALGALVALGAVGLLLRHNAPLPELFHYLYADALSICWCGFFTFTIV
jgi:hypothetical protein